MEVSGQFHAPAALPSGLSGPQSRSGHYVGDKNLPPTGNRNPAVQPVPRRYTERDIPGKKEVTKLSIYALVCLRHVSGFPQHCMTQRGFGPSPLYRLCVPR
jgi:hypothetical protein